MGSSEETFNRAFLPQVPNTDHDVEQAMRLRVFRMEHPEWFIEWDGIMLVWRAAMQLPNGVDSHYRHMLPDLLDKLERVMKTEQSM
jgi:hypothetical protein